MTTRKISLNIDSDLANARLVGLATRGLCQLTDLDSNAIAQTELGVVEAVNDIISRAYQGQLGHEVSIDVELSSQELTIQITDTGASFDPSILEQADVDPTQSDPDSWSPDLQWLAILKNTMDEVDYYAVGGVNTLCLRKCIEARRTS